MAIARGSLLVIKRRRWRPGMGRFSPSLPKELSPPLQPAIRRTLQNQTLKEKCLMATTAVARPINSEKLNALLGQAVADMGAAMHAPLIVIGDRLGLYRAMGDGGPVTPAELARRTGTAERYVQEWLNANAAAHYVEYDAAAGAYFMSPEQAFALAQDDTGVDIARR